MDLLEFLFRWVEEKVNKDKRIIKLQPVIYSIVDDRLLYVRTI